MYDLFEHMSVSDQGGGGKRPTMMGKRGGKPSRKKTTVSSQFKVSTLMNHAIAGFNFISIVHLHIQLLCKAQNVICMYMYIIATTQMYMPTR